MEQPHWLHGSFDDGDVQSLLSPETSRTLIANLQGLEVEDRARVTTSLLAFVGLFVAELLKVVNDAEHGERVELLQRRILLNGQDELSLVQTTRVVGPGTFAKLLVDLQANLEMKGKVVASSAARHLSRRLQSMQEGSGKRMADRRDRLRALLVAYGNEETGLEEGEAPEVDLIWNSICPFITEENDKTAETEQRASGSAAGVFDIHDERDGILVQRRPGEDWKPATKQEANELLHHDRQVQEEEQAQARADAEAFTSLEAARARQWEDWALHSEMQAPTQTRKRVRATVVMGTQQGTTVQEIVMQGDVAATETVMLTFVVSESLIEEGRDQISAGTNATQEGAPPTPSTIPVTETQVERQLLGAQTGRPRDVDLDGFMNTEEGREGFQQWTAGSINDDSVRERWGKDDVLELFQVMKTIEDDSQALRTQQEKPPRERAVASTMMERVRGSSSEPGMEGFGKEERKSKRIREGAIASTVGYVGPMDDVNDEGEVQVHECEETQGEALETMENGDRGHAAEDCNEDMDVQELDDMHLLQTEAAVQEGDAIFFMQKEAMGKFERLANQLLQDLDGMPRPRAARISGFLKSMMRDQQRMAPHLRHPVLLARAESLQALVSVFLDDEAHPQDDEQEWCLGVWQSMLPYLEGEATSASGRGEDQPSCEADCGPAAEEAIHIVDSQEATIEEGSKKQMVVVEKDHAGYHRGERRNGELRGRNASRGG